jgi:hypothetical protein
MRIGRTRTDRDSDGRTGSLHVPGRGHREAEIPVSLIMVGSSVEIQSSALKRQGIFSMEKARSDRLPRRNTAYYGFVRP